MNEIAWNSGNAGNAVHAVGTRKPNAWGLYDMLGNVFELTLDLAAGYPSPDSASGYATDPKGAATGSNKIWKGCSSWVGTDWTFMGYRRTDWAGTKWDAACGFRVVCDAVAK